MILYEVRWDSVTESTINYLKILGQQLGTSKNVLLHYGENTADLANMCCTWCPTPCPLPPAHTQARGSYPQSANYSTLETSTLEIATLEMSSLEM